MKNYVLFDVAEGTQNLGDYIIMKCIMEEMEYLFSDKYITHYSTHTPIARLYQNFRRNMQSRACGNANKKFLCGASTIKNSLFRICPDWNINVFNIKYYKDCITIGVGMDMNSSYFDPYTKYIYKRILNKNFIHSVRDERTKQFFDRLGLKAINTGCPTIWGLTSDLCKQIPKEKTENVVFTLTFYDKDNVKDQKLIDILKNNYKKIYFWVQGSEDYEYFLSLKNTDGIEVISPSLDAYEKVLNQDDVEFVGTRLHAGIFALKHKKRSIIISIDNRAEDMAKTYHLHTIKRTEIEKLDDKINSSFSTNIKINIDGIKKWKKQFLEE